MVNARNQTREYGGGDVDDTDLGVEPGVWNQEMDDSALDREPLAEEDEILLRAPDETREPGEEEQQMETKYKCPRGDHGTDRFKKNGAPAICNKCRNEAISETMKKVKGKTIMKLAD